MGHDLDPGVLADQLADFQPLGDAAAPGRVGLHEVNALAVEERFDGPLGIPVFAASDGQARLPLDPYVAVDVLGADCRSTRGMSARLAR